MIQVWRLFGWTVQKGRFAILSKSAAFTGDSQAETKERPEILAIFTGSFKCDCVFYLGFLFII